MIEIKHKLTGEVLHTVDADSLVGADLSGLDLSDADLSHANLRYADLSHANLHNANLSDADLYRANLSYANLFKAALYYNNLLQAKGLTSITTNKWNIYAGITHTKIGPHWHSNKEWLEFIDEEIAAMDDGALDWWKQYKPLFEAAVKALEEQPND